MRTFSFRNSKQTYNGIPIIVSNMDTTGTFSMAKTLGKVCLAPEVLGKGQLIAWLNYLRAKILFLSCFFVF